MHSRVDGFTSLAVFVGAVWEGYWVDPLDEKKFGPNSKYFKLNIAEAKKLMTAAGFPMCGESDLKTCIAMLLMDRIDNRQVCDQPDRWDHLVRTLGTLTVRPEIHNMSQPKA